MKLVQSIIRSKGNEGFYLNILITVQLRAHVVALIRSKCLITNYMLI